MIWKRMIEIKRETFVNIYSQHGAQDDDENEIIKLHFGETLKYLQTGNSLIELETTIEKTNITTFTDNDEIKLVKNAFP